MKWSNVKIYVNNRQAQKNRQLLQQHEVKSCCCCWKEKHWQEVNGYERFFSLLSRCDIEFFHMETNPSFALTLNLEKPMVNILKT